jgi:uncharacterized protein (TIGR00255 family)
MTGFGRGASGGVTAEVRSVNHRFVEVACRAARDLAPLEDRIRRLVLSEFHRGRVEVRVEAEGAARAATALHVDKDLAKAYHEALKELANILGVSWQPNLEALVSLPGVVSLREAQPDVEALWPDVEAALRDALAGAREMRRSEGEALAADLAARVDELAGLVAGVAARAPELAALMRERLARRLGEVLAPGAVDPDRIEAEVALLAERAAIDEEIVRLGSHIDQFRAALAEPGPVGRKLDFIVQELHREVNTIGSKAADAGVALAVVEAKGIVEKLREQVQNVE